MQKLHNIDSSDRKIWGILKKFLFFFSICVLVCWGYLKSNNENPVGNKSTDPVEQRISGGSYNNDSIYYAFSKIISEYSQGRK